LAQVFEKLGDPAWTGGACREGLEATKVLDHRMKRCVATAWSPGKASAVKRWSEGLLLLLAETEPLKTCTLFTENTKTPILGIMCGGSIGDVLQL
jgi:hypothetical protein